jgi:hypothetical protein
MWTRQQAKYKEEFKQLCEKIRVKRAKEEEEAKKEMVRKQREKDEKEYLISNEKRMDDEYWYNQLRALDKEQMLRWGREWIKQEKLEREMFGIEYKR